MLPPSGRSLPQPLEPAPPQARSLGPGLDSVLTLDCSATKASGSQGSAWVDTQRMLAKPKEMGTMPDLHILRKVHDHDAERSVPMDSAGNATVLKVH